MIKTLSVGERFSFFDVSETRRTWLGIPLSKRVQFIEAREAAKSAILHSDDWLPLLLKALEIAGFKKDWVQNDSGSIAGALLIGDVDPEGAIPSLIDAAEYPYSFEPAVPQQSAEPSEPTEPERLDEIWLTTMTGEVVEIKPLTGNQRRRLDFMLDLIKNTDSGKSIRETYDKDSVFCRACDQILSLYRVPVDQIGITEMIELIFLPGYLHQLEIPLMQTIGGEKLPKDEDPYDAVVASLCLTQPRISVMEHSRVLDELPWVRLQSILASTNSLSDKLKSESGDQDGAPSKGKAKAPGKKSAPKPSAWKKSEYDHTKSLLDKLKSGEATVRPMSKLQQRGLGG